MRDVYHGSPIGLNLIVGSATTYQGKPPSFDLLYLDPDTMLPVDIETYAFDLEGANKDDSAAVWKLHTDYRNDYGLADLSPSSFKALSDRIHTDPAVCQQYMTNSAAGGPKFPQTACSENDQWDQYCQTIASDSDELYECKDQQKKTRWDGGRWLNYFVNGINYQWYEQKQEEHQQ